MTTGLISSLTTTITAANETIKERDAEIEGLKAKVKENYFKYQTIIDEKMAFLVAHDVLWDYQKEFKLALHQSIDKQIDDNAKMAKHRGTFHNDYLQFPAMRMEITTKRIKELKKLLDTDPTL